jgi:hypothetical protein
MLALTPRAQEPKSVQRVIDLKAIGYPQPPCDYMFQVDYYHKTHIEFLDSERLLVSFPADVTSCDKQSVYSGRSARTYRSVVMDLSGKILHSLDWKSGENVQAGPDGHIILLTGNNIHILDWDFSLIQNIPALRPLAIWEAKVSPSRHGFAILGHYPGNQVVYFEGTPVRKAQDVEDCDFIAVVDGGFLCRDTSQPGQFIAHVSDEAQSNQQMINAIAKGITDETPDRKWLIPGRPAWISRVATVTSGSGRILYFCTGTRFPVTDTSGFGYFLRVAVVDVLEKRTIFRKQYDINSDVALSPDGRWFAVREQTRLTLRKL